MTGPCIGRFTARNGHRSLAAGGSGLASIDLVALARSQSGRWRRPREIAAVFGKLSRQVTDGICRCCWSNVTVPSI